VALCCLVAVDLGDLPYEYLLEHPQLASDPKPAVKDPKHQQVSIAQSHQSFGISEHLQCWPPQARNLVHIFAG